MLFVVAMKKYKCPRLSLATDFGDISIFSNVDTFFHLRTREQAIIYNLQFRSVLVSFLKLGLCRAVQLEAVPEIILGGDFCPGGRLFDQEHVLGAVCNQFCRGWGVFFCGSCGT